LLLECNGRCARLRTGLCPGAFVRGADKNESYAVDGRRQTLERQTAVLTKLAAAAAG